MAAPVKAAPNWTRELIGIPFRDHGRDRAGVDCWGLAVLAYADALGIELPSYAGEYASADERREIAAIVAREAASPLWRAVDLTAAEPLDILMFRHGRFDAHAALFVAPGLMLHMQEEDCSKIARFDSGMWAPRLTGVYRWRGRT